MNLRGPTFEKNTLCRFKNNLSFCKSHLLLQHHQAGVDCSFLANQYLAYFTAPGSEALALQIELLLLSSRHILPVGPALGGAITQVQTGVNVIGDLHF